MKDAVGTLVLIVAAFLCLWLLVAGLRVTKDAVDAGGEVSLQDLFPDKSNAMPAEVPGVGAIQHRAHAVEKHGEDAIEARKAIQKCSNLRVKICAGSSNHGLSVAYWCETGLTLCPGTYTTISGLEKTSFIQSCTAWSNCK
jgi:hypothetical protein